MTPPSRMRRRRRRAFAEGTAEGRSPRASCARPLRPTPPIDGLNGAEQAGAPSVCLEDLRERERRSLSCRSCPVTPTTSSARDGCRRSAAASGAIAARTSATTISGTPSPSGRSHTSADRPALDRVRGEVMPVRPRIPRTQKKSVPGGRRVAAISEAGHLRTELRVGEPADPRTRKQVASRDIGKRVPSQCARDSMTLVPSGQRLQHHLGAMPR